MTSGEARAWLDVTPEASADEVRRAYLRKVKQHKPERDPDGFRRCREAYECLTRGAIDVVVGSNELRVRERGAPMDEPAIDSDGDTPDDHEDGEDGDAPAMGGEDDDDAFWTFIDTLDQKDDPDERIAALRDACQAYPDDVRWVLELERELRNEGELELAANVLREAGERGLRGLDPILFRCHLERLTDAELERLEKSPLRDGPQLRALALVQRRRVPDAVALAMAQLERDPTPTSWLPLVFTLYEREALQGARDVLDSIQKRVTDRGEGMRLPAHAQLALITAGQLSQVADLLDAEIVEVIARALRTRAFAEAHADLLAYRRRDPVAGWDAAKILQGNTPALAEQFAASLAGNTVQAPNSTPRPPIWALFIVLPLLRLCAGTVNTSDPPNPYAYHRPTSHRAPSRDEAPSFDDTPRLPVWSEEGDGSLEAPVASDVRPDEGGPMVSCTVDPFACRRLATASRALDAGACARAAAGLRSFDRLVGGTEGAIADLRDRLDGRFHVVCSEGLGAPSGNVLWGDGHEGDVDPLATESTP
jgi:hypothetical protein